MISATCFGIDKPEYLYMWHITTKQPHFKDPLKFLNNFNNQINPLHREMFLTEKQCGVQIYGKNDNYNFENSIELYKNFLQYFNRTSNIYFPIYILKNTQWYYCSPETDMILLPIGEQITK